MSPASRPTDALNALQVTSGSLLDSIFSRPGGREAVQNCFIDLTRVLYMGEGLAEHLCMELLAHHPERVPDGLKERQGTIAEHVLKVVNLPHIKRVQDEALQAFRKIGIPADQAETVIHGMRDVATINVLENRYPAIDRSKEYQWAGDETSRLQHFRMTEDTITLGFKSTELRDEFRRLLSPAPPGQSSAPQESPGPLRRLLRRLHPDQTPAPHGVLGREKRLLMGPQAQVHLGTSLVPQQESPEDEKRLVLKTDGPDPVRVLDLLSRKFDFPPESMREAAEIFFPRHMRRLSVRLNAKGNNNPPFASEGSSVSWGNQAILLWKVLDTPLRAVTFHFTKEGLLETVQIICSDEAETRKVFDTLKKDSSFTPETRLADFKREGGTYIKDRCLYIPRRKIKDIDALAQSLKDMGMAMKTPEENMFHTLLDMALQKEAGRNRGGLA